MSFVRSRIALPTSGKHVHAFRYCSKCDEHKAPEGGIEMAPGRWLCAACWTRRAIGGKR